MTAPETSSGLPVISWPERSDYGCVTVRRHEDGRLEVIGEVPVRVAFAAELLAQADPRWLRTEGRRITLSASNGSWTWLAEATNTERTEVYASREETPRCCPRGGR